MHPLHETQAASPGSLLNGLSLLPDCIGRSCSGSQAVVEEQSQETVIFAQSVDQFHLHREVVHLVDQPPLQSIPLALGLVIHQFHFNSRWSGVD